MCCVAWKSRAPGYRGLRCRLGNQGMEGVLCVVVWHVHEWSGLAEK